MYYTCIRVFPSVRADLVRTKRREDALLSLRSLSVLAVPLRDFAFVFENDEHVDSYRAIINCDDEEITKVPFNPIRRIGSFQC